MTRSLVLFAFIVWAGCTASPEAPPSSPIGEKIQENSPEGPLPEDLLLRLDHDLSELPQGAEKSLPAHEFERLRRLRESRRGTPKDKEFLERRILGEAIPTLKKQAEQAHARQEEAKPKDPTEGPYDLVTMNDGRKIKGRVVEDTAEFVTIRTRFGSVKIRRADVMKIEYGAGGDPK